MPQRILKHAILGLLFNEDLSGYDLSVKFADQNLSSFWNANHSQIYTEMKKLLEEGLVESSVEIVGEKLEKKMYTITQKGREDFLGWLSSEYKIPHTEKDIFALKSFFIANLSPQEQLKQFQSQLKQRMKKEQILLEDYSSKYADSTNDMLKENLGDFLVLKKAIYRERSYIMWLKESIALLEGL